MLITSRKLIGGKSKFDQLTNKFLTYGIQSTAYDFAFSKQEDFTSRTLLEHATIFASGGMAGASIGQIGEYGKDISFPLSLSRSISSISWRKRPLVPVGVIAENGEEELFNFSYYFKPESGNLRNRNLHGMTEWFEYDNGTSVKLHRLTGAGLDPDDMDVNYWYSSNGNMVSKSDVGQYTYDPTLSYQVSQIDFEGGVDPEDPLIDMVGHQAVVYNYFNSASLIHDFTSDRKVELFYGPDDHRRMAVYKEGDDEVKTRYYVGAYEKQIDHQNQNNEIRVHYISALGQLVAIYVEDDSEQVTDEGLNGKMYYPHLDHLGSIIHITDANGDIVYTQSFDAWGRTRNPSDLTYDNVPPRPNWLWRGYTGHEHLDEFGLINMNGRLYDPVVGRMLSPDNYVQSPDFSQSYNRYSYVWNNPLKYTDPTGELIDLYFLFFTKPGYKLQEFISPIAFTARIPIGSNQNGVGFDVSFGVPQSSGLGYRRHYGETHYKNTLGGNSGREIRKGGTWTVMLPVVGNVHFSGTTFSGMGQQDQTTHSISADLIPGAPGLFGGTYENDTFLGNYVGQLPGIPEGNPNSDQLRTAAAEINLFGVDVGIQLHTGSWDGQSVDGVIDGEQTSYAIGGNIDDPSQSHGIFYLQFGNMRVGRDTERIRHYFQNVVAHDGFNGGYRGSVYPWILQLDRDPKWYFQFGSGGGNSLY